MNNSIKIILDHKEILCNSVVINSENGQICLLPNHCSILCSGELIYYKDLEFNKIDMSIVGIFYLKNNVINII